MDKKLSLSLDTQDMKVSAQRVASKFGAHSTFIIWMTVFGFLMYAFIVMSSILAINDDQAYRDEQTLTRINSSFDNATIEKVDNLKASDDPSAIDLPAGRRNPFAN